MGGWLRRNFVEKYKHNTPSWRALAIAVKSPSGGESGAGAEKIAKNYKGVEHEAEEAVVSSV